MPSHFQGLVADVVRVSVAKLPEAILTETFDAAIFEHCAVKMVATGNLRRADCRFAKVNQWQVRSHLIRGVTQAQFSLTAGAQAAKIISTPAFHLAFGFKQGTVVVAGGTELEELLRCHLWLPGNDSIEGYIGVVGTGSAEAPEAQYFDSAGECHFGPQPVASLRALSRPARAPPAATEILEFQGSNATTEHVVAEPQVGCVCKPREVRAQEDRSPSLSLQGWTMNAKLGQQTFN